MDCFLACQQPAPQAGWGLQHLPDTLKPSAARTYEPEALATHTTAANVEALFGKQMKGTLTSPCDCKVARQLVADGQFANKGDVIFELVPQNTKATIQASFPYRDFSRARPGSRARFWVAGEDSPRYGKIVSSSLHQGGLSADIRVLIEPEQSLDSSLAGQPVEVILDRGPSFDWVIDKALAAGL